MDKDGFTRIVIQNSRSTRYYSEQEAAEYCQLDVQVIRRLRTVGLIEGIESVEGEQRYSDEDVEQLRRIRRLHRDLGVNLAGIEVILRLCSRLKAMQEELERYKRGEGRGDTGSAPPAHENPS